MENVNQFGVSDMTGYLPGDVSSINMQLSGNLSRCITYYSESPIACIDVVCNTFNIKITESPAMTDPPL